MRKRLLLAAFLAAVAPVAAAADVAPLTPEGRIMMQQREALESHARASFGDPGLVEKLRDWRRNWGFVIVGTEGSRRAPTVLAKDEYGWYEMRPGGTKRLPLPVGHALNRLLTSAAIWNEQPYNWGAQCRAAPRLFILGHAGHDAFGRLGCGKEGLASRVARIAETLRSPPHGSSAILPSWSVPPVGGVPVEQQLNNADLFERLSQMTASWERRTLAGYVDPYAQDVIVERPEGTFKGRKPFVDWVKHQQDWNAPYPEKPTRMVVHQMTIAAQPSDKVLYTTHELRWEQEGKPVRQTFSTMWRNNAGLWEIAYERASEVKPVTERSPR
jgi:hypothetical protein